MSIFSLNRLPSDISKGTAQKHRKLRRSLKISQVDLAKRSGVSLGSIKRFERTGKISFDSLLKLAHILGRLSDFEDLFEVRDNFKEIEKLFSDKTR